MLVDPPSFMYFLHFTNAFSVFIVISYLRVRYLSRMQQYPVITTYNMFMLVTEKGSKTVEKQTPSIYSRLLRRLYSWGSQLVLC